MASARAQGMRVLFVSHPEVVVDPAVPVPRWHLTDRGIGRLRALAARLTVPEAIWASTETKAIEGAGILAARFGLPVAVHAGLDENDRSATGYLPEPEFTAAADAFFAQPGVSFRGWETARAAQARVMAAFAAVRGADFTLVVGHGATGTLLLCGLAGWPISRVRDQPGAGHAWGWTHAQGVTFPWMPLEALADPRFIGG